MTGGEGVRVSVSMLTIERASEKQAVMGRAAPLQGRIHIYICFHAAAAEKLFVLAEFRRRIRPASPLTTWDQDEDREDGQPCGSGPVQPGVLGPPPAKLGSLLSLLNQ